MSNRKHGFHWLTATALSALAGAAAAWTPYGLPPYGPQPGQPMMPLPYPPPGSAYHMPGQFPALRRAASAADTAAPVAPAQHAGQERNGTLGSYPAAERSEGIGNATFDQHMTADDYILDIDGVDPTQVQVDAFGRALIVRIQRSMEVHRQETLDDGRGVARSFSWSSGRSARRLSVPSDGDLDRLSREDSDERVRIVIPRRQGEAPGGEPNEPSKQDH